MLFNMGGTSLWAQYGSTRIENLDVEPHYSPAMFPRLYGCLAVALFGPSCATLLNLPDEPTAAGLEDLQFSFRRKQDKQGTGCKVYNGIVIPK